MDIYQRRPTAIDWSFYQQPQSPGTSPGDHLERDPGLQLPQTVAQVWNSLQPSTRQSVDNGSGADGRGSLGGPSSQSGQSLYDAVNNALHGPNPPGQGGIMPSWGDIGRGAVGQALGYPGSGALSMFSLMNKDNPTTRDIANTAFTLMGGPMGGLKGIGNAISSSQWARENPIQAYLNAGAPQGIDPQAAQITDQAWRGGAGTQTLTDIYQAMMDSKNQGGAGHTNQTVADINASIQQIQDAIAMGKADPSYTQGNPWGAATNTINAANNTGTATYSGLPMDIMNTIYASEKAGTPVDNETLANYGLARDSQGNIVGTGQPSAGNVQQTFDTFNQGAQSQDAGYGSDAMGGYDPGAGSNEAGYNDSASYDNTGGGGFDPGLLKKGGPVKHYDMGGRVNPGALMGMMRGRMPWQFHNQEHYGPIPPPVTPGHPSPVNMMPTNNGIPTPIGRMGYADGGQVATAEQVLMDLATKYNPKAIGNAVARTQSRAIKGQGGGLDDAIPAMIDGQQPAALSNDEHVFPADVVSALGDGSSDTGHKILKELVNLIRQKKFGDSAQPPKLRMGLSSLLQNATRNVNS